MQSYGHYDLYSSPTDEISDVITDKDAAEFIFERYNNCEFARNVKMFDNHPHQDLKMQKQIAEEMKKNPHSMRYTIKEVEGVYLIHKNNKVLVQRLYKQEYWTGTITYSYIQA